MRFLALLLSVVLVQSPLALPPTRDQFLALFGGYIDALRVQAGIPGMAGAIIGSDTDLLWQQAFGQLDIGQNVPTRTDTTFQFDGLTQLVTATMVLQCVEQGTTTLDARIGLYTPSSPDAGATVAQILTHTSGTAGNLSFNYNTARLDALKFVVEGCTGLTFRQAFRKTLEGLGMMDSVPGPDAPLPELSNADVVSQAVASRYWDVLHRIAAPYAVDAQGVATPSQYTVKTLSAGSGLVSNIFDFAKFDVALKSGGLLRADTLATAWHGPVNADGSVLPHGMGWFVQSYNGEPVLWQFGVEANASSSLVITLPARSVTLILLANSDGLAKPATLTAGDITVSPFARIFLGLVVR